MQLMSEAELKAWDQYAAGALALCSGISNGAKVEIAAEIADRLIAERRKREPDRLTQEGLRISNPYRQS